MKIWVVAEHSFEWFTVRYLCLSKETALERWKEIRDEMIEEMLDMIEYERKNNFSGGHWYENLRDLQIMHQGDSLDYCDYPYIREWEVEP